MKQIVDATLAADRLFFEAARRKVDEGALEVLYLLGNHDRLLAHAPRGPRRHPRRPRHEGGRRALPHLARRALPGRDPPAGRLARSAGRVWRELVEELLENGWVRDWMKRERPAGRPLQPGTWRQLRQRGNVARGRPAFPAYDAAAHLVFLGRGDPLGRTFEWWQGAGGVSVRRVEVGPGSGSGSGSTC